MSLKSAVFAFKMPTWPDPKTAYTLWLVGSATIGPAMLLCVACPVVRRPAPVIASPTRFHVKPSSSERCTRISAELPASWYEMYLRSVRSDPRSVVTRKVDNLRRATADVEIRCSSTRTGDRRNRDQGFLKRLVHRNDKRSSMHRAGRAHVHICITASENDSKARLSQCVVYCTLEVRRKAKIAGLQLRAARGQ